MNIWIVYLNFLLIDADFSGLTSAIWWEWKPKVTEQVFGNESLFWGGAWADALYIHAFAQCNQRHITWFQCDLQELLKKTSIESHIQRSIELTAR